jgi:hypothetical protein
MNRKKNKSKKNKSRPFTAIDDDLKKLGEGKITQCRGFERVESKTDLQAITDIKRRNKIIKGMLKRAADRMTWQETVVYFASWAEDYLEKRGLPTGVVYTRNGEGYKPSAYVLSQGYRPDYLEYAAARILELAPRHC